MRTLPIFHPNGGRTYTSSSPNRPPGTGNHDRDEAAKPKQIAYARI
jgi:hypothetical protein